MSGGRTPSTFDYPDAGAYHIVLARQNRLTWLATVTGHDDPALDPDKDVEFLRVTRTGALVAAQRWCDRHYRHSMYRAERLRYLPRVGRS